MKRQSGLLRGAAATALAGLLSVMPLSARAETMLIMAEEIGCVWCAMWDREIAPIYPKTAEGQAAPLHRIDIHDQPPEGVTLASRIVFTPTFILVEDGAEVARIEGYPGEDFFWGLLGQMLKKAEIAYDRSG